MGKLYLCRISDDYDFKRNNRKYREGEMVMCWFETEKGDKDEAVSVINTEDKLPYQIVKNKKEVS